jgi:hypothetical protein
MTACQVRKAGQPRWQQARPVPSCRDACCPSAAKWPLSLPPLLCMLWSLVAGREEERPWIADHVHTPAARDFPPGATRKRPLIYV